MAQPAPIPLGPRTPAKPPPTFSYLLADSIQRASSRTADSKLIYEPIAALWDEYLASDAVRKLPARLRHPMNSLCKDFILTAQRHFDSYLSGMPLNPPNPATSIREPNSRASAPPTAPGPSSNTPPPNPPPPAPGHQKNNAEKPTPPPKKKTPA